MPAIQLYNFSGAGLIGANFTAQTLLTAKQTYKQTHKQNKYKETKEITTHTYAHTHKQKKHKETKETDKATTQTYNSNI